MLGGETLLEEELIPIIRGLLEEGHYVGVVTNGTVTRNIEAFSKFPPNLIKHLFIKFSFHYGELKRLNKLTDFFKMVNLVKSFGASFSIELPAYDEFLSENETIIAMCKKEVGAVPHVATLRDECNESFSILSKYSFKELNDKWSVYDSKLFEIRSEVMEKRYKGFCYAGDWTFVVNLETGEAKQCHYERTIGNIYDKTKPMEFIAVGNHCHSEYCYACHAFLTLGAIPDLNFSIRYSDTRNREEAGWLTEEMKNFMNQRLDENNKSYNFIKRILVNEKNRRIEASEYKSPADFSKSVIIAMKNEPLKNNYVVVESRHLLKLMYRNEPSEIRWLNHIYQGNFNELNKEKASEVYIEALERKAKEACGDEIWIVGALVDDCWYDAQDIFEETWLKKMRMLGWRSYDNQGIGRKIKGYIPEGKRRFLVLEKNKWRGICRIEINGNFQEIDTYSEIDDDIYFYFIK